MRAVLAQSKVEAILTLRRGESLIVTLGIPVGILAFFGTVDLVDTGFKDPLDFLVPGVLALAVTSTAMVSLGIATGFERRYVLKYRWLWEQKHGPLPEGMCLKCKGDPLNTDPSNWEVVPRGLLPRLNNRWGRGYDSAPDELKPTIMAVAKLEHRLREKSR